MAKKRKAKKSARRPAKRKVVRRKAAKRKVTRGKRRKASKPTSIIGKIAGAVRETVNLRQRLEGRNTFED